SLDEAIERARAAGEAELFVCGGEAVYREALPKADRMVLTRVEAEPEGDTRFPEPDWRRWKLASRNEHEPDDRNPHTYTFEVHERA
ncbi:MAG TPA: dihydrofolate reductase, partial [Thermoanaerobaculia bacterium]|nr:dihydrofolate reductase [Thermoanaerobaculia bacterium]